MPESHHGEEPLSGKDNQQANPARYVFASRRWLLLLVMYILGLPVFFAILVPPSVGGWILWHQYALYREEGRWHEFSLYRLATLTVDEGLTARLLWPGLAACTEYRSDVPSTGSSGPDLSQAASEECPQLGPWQSWLLHPSVYPQWHTRAKGLLESIPVSSVFFLIGLLLSFVLQFFGMDWRFRSRPPPPAPPVSSSGIRNLTPSQRPSEDSDRAT